MNYSQNVIWNNKDIPINNKPVFYETYLDKGITYLNDLQFDVDNAHSYETIKQKGLTGNTNFLTWTAMRSSIINMKSKSFCSIPIAGSLDPMNFDYKSKSFNTHTAKCKQFYSMMTSSKARIPNGFKKLTADFELSNAHWSFQYRVLNFILFTNDKLFKIGLSDSDKCSFCGTYTEDLYRLFFNFSFVQAVSNVFQGSRLTVAN